jgi:hypothetical protein
MHLFDSKKGILRPKSGLIFKLTPYLPVFYLGPTPEHDSAIQTDNGDKKNKWTQSIAVGSKTFIEKMKESLGFRAKARKIICADDTFELREVIAPYGKANNLDSVNTFLWNQQPPALIGQFLHEN